MRVLLIHSSSELYGASKVAIETLRILKKNGHYVVFGLSQNGPLCDELTKLGCPLEIMTLATIRRKYFSLKGLINRFFSFRKSLKELKRVVDKHQIDLIYTSTTAVITGAVFSKKAGIKHVWHVLEITPGPYWVLKFYGYLLANYSNVVLGVSEAVRRHWAAINRKMNIKKLYNGFSYEPYSGSNDLRYELDIPKGAVLVGMVARVHFWKGQGYFLDIASRLKEMNGNIKFIMVGDAFEGYEYLYDEINTKIERLGLKEDVINLGYRTDINRILDGLDIFVLPSIQPDPLPTTVLEAMASGLPVVATNHGGAPEMVANKHTGLLIPWDDATKAVEKIDILVKDRDLRISMGEAGRSRVKNVFSNQQHEEGLIRILDEL